MQASQKLGTLLAALDKTEPSSHAIFFRVAKIAARLSGRHRLVLQQARTFLDRAMGLCANNPEYINELAFQLMLAEQVSGPP